MCKQNKFGVENQSLETYLFRFAAVVPVSIVLLLLLVDSFLWFVYIAINFFVGYNRGGSM